jgi:hypothetical protein
MTQYTRYNGLTDEELLTICDDHYANELIVELRQRLEEKIDFISGKAVHVCPDCDEHIY